MACPVREKLNGLKAFWLNPVLLSHDKRSGRTGATKKDSEQSEPRQTKRVGVGSNPFTNPAHGVRAKAPCAIGVEGRKTLVPRQGSFNVRGPGSYRAATCDTGQMTMLGVQVT